MNVAAVERESVWSFGLGSQLETVKWLGLFVMLADHVGLYVSGQTYISEALGAMAFPLFVAALAVGIAPVWELKGSDLTWRLFRWGCVAEVARLFVERDALPLNVLFTLALGCLLYSAWDRREDFGSMPRLVMLAVAVLSVFVEFATPGVVLTASAIALVRGGGLGALLLCAAQLSALSFFNGGSHFAWAAVAVLAVLAVVPVGVGRVRRFFYIAYAVQWPLLWVAATSFAVSSGSA